MGGNGSMCQKELDGVTALPGPFNPLAGGGGMGSQDGGFKPVPEQLLTPGVSPSPGMPPVPPPQPPKKWLKTDDGKRWMKEQRAKAMAARAAMMQQAASS
eukprot:TRINITY_DN11762_c0_g1_i1.p3 TRINITY_DN11762_c0_g1~~TRINITY_DN11762_c0_g1_i1.p3  ORF type:complete len:100 (+),score=39.86 TRINITY_DN11762_c0_g1_i1:89-388(+)